jgi:2-polyprenyl-6-methoxyphenol hydroxylase-like FAD-dependent oxidoreductase
VVEAGRSGLFITLLLVRDGIADRYSLCLDHKPSTLKTGQADGLQPRTLEVLQSLGIASEIMQEVCNFVADTDFPDTSNRWAVHSSSNSDITPDRSYSHEAAFAQMFAKRRE